MFVLDQRRQFAPKLSLRTAGRTACGCSPLRKAWIRATYNLIRGEVFDIAIAMTANTDNARGHAYANEALPKLEQAFTQALRALLTHQPASDPVEWCARWLLRGISEKLGADAFCAQTPTIAQGQGTAAWQSPRLTGSPTRRLTPCIPPLPLGKLRWNDVNFEPSSFSERASEEDSSTVCSQQLSLRDEPVAEVQEPGAPLGVTLGAQLFDKGGFVRHGPTRLLTRAVPMLGPIADHLNYLVPSPSLFQQTHTASTSTEEELADPARTESRAKMHAGQTKVAAPVEMVDGAEFDTGGRHSGQKMRKPTVNIITDNTQPEMEPAPRPPPAEASPCTEASPCAEASPSTEAHALPGRGTVAQSAEAAEHAKVAAGGEHAKGGELPPTPVPSAEEVEAGAPAVAPGPAAPAAASAAATSAEAGAAAAERAPDGASIAQTERPPRDSHSHLEETEDRREPPMAANEEDVAAAEVVAETVAEAVAEAVAKAVAFHTWTG